MSEENGLSLNMSAQDDGGEILDGQTPAVEDFDQNGML